MARDPKRHSHVEHALASIRLSGIQPSATFLALADQYRSGTISAGELIEKMKQHYLLPRPD
ncbi:hypothetical protein [Pseudomonas aeruginosa]|uniref:antitoxin VbhA family protein n=1 Tax=Pseudomonas aeruginosa TaxID=287 RepID=UPI00345A1BAD|nr:hypothetical protein [Pseudomonas aeruginosa]